MHQPRDLNSKIVPRADIADRAARLKADGKRVVFTNGCFDLLHAGHVHLLQDARGQGDVLIVGLNSDASVRIIKGPQRPVVPQGERAQVLASLESVDCVVLFDEPDPGPLIDTIIPQVLVKGGDWAKDHIVGAGTVERNGGTVLSLPLVGGCSTTDIISTVLKKCTPTSS